MDRIFAILRCEANFELTVQLMSDHNDQLMKRKAFKVLLRRNRDGLRGSYTQGSTTGGQL